MSDEDQQADAVAGLDLGRLMETAMSMQSQLADAQAAHAANEVTGSAGGGLVKVTMRGTGQVVGVAIAPEAVDPDDLEILEDLIAAASNDAVSQLAALEQDLFGGAGPDQAALGDLSGLGIDVSALGLGDEPES